MKQRQREAAVRASFQQHAGKHRNRKGWKGKVLTDGIFYRGKSDWTCEEGPDYDSLTPLEDCSVAHKTGPVRPVPGAKKSAPPLLTRCDDRPEVQRVAHTKPLIDALLTVKAGDVVEMPSSEASEVLEQGRYSPMGSYSRASQYEANQVDMNESVLFEGEGLIPDNVTPW
jgi:hypothetical protein